MDKNTSSLLALSACVTPQEGDMVMIFIIMISYPQKPIHTKCQSIWLENFANFVAKKFGKEKIENSTLDLNCDLV